MKFRRRGPWEPEVAEGAGRRWGGANPRAAADGAGESGEAPRNGASTATTASGACTRGQGPSESRSDARCEGGAPRSKWRAIAAPRRAREAKRYRTVNRSDKRQMTTRSASLVRPPPVRNQALDPRLNAVRASSPGGAALARPQSTAPRAAAASTHSIVVAGCLSARRATLPAEKRRDGLWCVISSCAESPSAIRGSGGQCQRWSAPNGRRDAFTGARETLAFSD